MRFLDVAIASIGGDPETDACAACGYAWRPEVEAAVAAVRSAPERFADALDAGDPYRLRDPLTWSAAAYTWHVADVCRAWAERTVSLREEPDRPLAGFDQDELAAARNYSAMSVSAAAWALSTSAHQLVSEVAQAGTDQAFRHPDWGAGTLGDALRWVGHELVHHERDVRWILEAG